MEARSIHQRQFALRTLAGLSTFLCGALLPANGRAGAPPAPSAVQVLSGEWKIAVDPRNQGRAEHWFEAIRPDAQPAPVPGIIQQVFPGYHGLAWYWHSFHLGAPAGGDRLLLHFGAVDYLADVWVNGKPAGSYEGGETPFEFERHRPGPRPWREPPGRARTQSDRPANRRASPWARRRTATRPIRPRPGRASTAAGSPTRWAFAACRRFALSTCLPGRTSRQAGLK